MSKETSTVTPVVKERPILFSGDMVRALLADRKTQTRRVVKDQPLMCVSSSRAQIFGRTAQWREVRNDLPESIAWQHGGPIHDESVCPYGKVGERLWVRETNLPKASGTIYRADFHPSEAAGLGGMYGGWKPSIFCKRSDSRITLEITVIRVERLQDISEADAMAEGCIMDGKLPKEQPHKSGIGAMGWDSAMEWYSWLWEEINGEGSWDKNPWVWVIEFKRINEPKAFYANSANPHELKPEKISEDSCNSRKTISQP